jgi:hypothetical protein
MCPNIIHRPFAVEGRDNSVKDELPKGLKIQGTDDPSKYVRGYLVQGQLNTALHRVPHLYYLYFSLSIGKKDITPAVFQRQ